MEQELYDLPEGWEWAQIEKVAKIGVQKGFTPMPDENGMVPFVGMTHINQETGFNSKYELKHFEQVKKGYTKFGKDAVLIAKITPCTENNKTALFDFLDGGFATTEVYPVHPLQNISSIYLLYFIRSQHVRNLLISQMEGATGRQRVPLKALQQIRIPLPPLDEQKRIVKKLDALLSRIDEAIVHLNESLELAEALFASSLDKIFNPLGSTKNTEGTYDLPEGWEWKKLGEITNLITKGTTPTTIGFNYENNGINFIKIESIMNDKITSSSIKSFISSTAHEKLFRSQLKEYDILFSIAGSIGTSALVTKDILPANTNQALAIIRGYLDYAIPNYLLNALRSNLSELTKSKKRGGALQNISLIDIKNTKIPLPPLEEQKRISNKLDQISANNKILKEKVQSQIDDLNALKASLLDAAFKGEL